VKDRIDDGSGNGQRLLGHRDFALFALSRACAVTSSQMLTVAVGWTLYLRSGNPLDLGLVGLARFLPVLLLFLWAGMAADHYSRPWIIGLSNAVQALAAGLIGLLLAASVAATWPVFLLLALHGAAQAFLQPAQQATLPNVVPRALLSRAVAATSSLVKAAQLGGPALAGLLIAVAAGATFQVIAALSVAAGASAAMIWLPKSHAPREGTGLGQILGGLRHIRHTPVVLGAITIDLIAVLFGGIMGLLPVFAMDILEVGPEALGIMRAMPALGGLGMGLLLGAIPPPRSSGLLFFLALGVFGLSTLVFSLSQALWLSLAALAVSGAADMFSVYVRQTLIQLGTPDALRGRVNAVNSVSVNASNELGDFRAGAMAALIGTAPAVAGGALVTLGAAALWWHIFPDLRRVDRI
jgi:hypothetical protein